MYLIVLWLIGVSSFPGLVIILQYIYIYIYIWLIFLIPFGQSAGAEEYTDCFSAEG